MSDNRRSRTTWGLVVGAMVITAGALYLARGQQAAQRRTTTATVRTDGTTTTGDPRTQSPATERAKIDVVFALDTTGSMHGLLEGAKRHIWAIAGRIAAGQPRPDLRIGLVGYRDHGDAYVTRHYDLTGDLDDVYAHLRLYRADGGGDTPEHVNGALQVAIDRMSWRQGSKVLRLVFLVGDAPPHEGRDGLHSSVLAQRARERGITINAVRCGSLASTEQAWRRLAGSTSGMYASIRQDGGMLTLTTPHDGRLAELNRKLSATFLASGDAALKNAARRRMHSNAAMEESAQAGSAIYRARSGKLDSGDLLTQLKKGRRLDSYRDAELPATVAALPRPARRAYVARVAQQRAALRTQILDLTKRRESALRRAKRKAGGGKGFDDAIGTALRRQGKRIGVAY